MATLVGFYVHEKEDSKDIFAFFPKLVFDSNGNKTAYSHIGQHSGCCIDYVKESRKATESEYLPLLNELKSIGYNNLKICK